MELGQEPPTMPHLSDPVREALIMLLCGPSGVWGWIESHFGRARQGQAGGVLVARTCNFVVYPLVYPVVKTKVKNSFSPW